MQVSPFCFQSCFKAVTNKVVLLEDATSFGVLAGRIVVWVDFYVLSHVLPGRVIQYINTGEHMLHTQNTHTHTHARTHARTHAHTQP